MRGSRPVWALYYLLCLVFLLTGTNGPPVKKISLQHLLVFPFLGLILLSVALVGYVSMRNGQQAVHRAALQKGTP